MVDKISEPVRLINLGQTASWKTQAYYHAVAELMTEDSLDTIILCQPTTPYLSLGYHQSFNVIFIKEVCKKYNLPVYRRRVGGGATYLDADQLFYQCVFHYKRAPLYSNDLYAAFLSAPVAALKRLGLNSELREINEVEVEGRRIAGIGGGRIGQASVVVGNILFDFDFDTMSKVWHAPSEAFRDIASVALQDRLTTISALLDDVSIKQIEELLVEEYIKSLGRPLVEGSLTSEELDLGVTIAEQMTSEEYLDMHSDRNVIGGKEGLKISAGVYVHASETKINEIPIEASFLVKDGIIQKVYFETESSGLIKDIKKLSEAMRGIQFDQWQEVVHRILVDIKSESIINKKLMQQEII